MFAQEDIRRTTLAYKVANMTTLFHVISGGVLDISKIVRSFILEVYTQFGIICLSCFER